MNRAHEVAESGGKYVIAFHCPGCGYAHTIDTNTWTWNGDLQRPTFTPSILTGGVQWDEGHEFHKPRHAVAAGRAVVCHSFVTDGRVQFLDDCTHALVGKTVDLPPWDQNGAS